MSLVVETVGEFDQSTCKELIVDAHDLLGISSLTAAEVERGRKSLNLLLKSLTNSNIYVHAIDDLEDAIDAAVFIPIAGTKDVDAMWLSINSQDVELRKLSNSEWHAIVNKTTTGQPLYFWVDKSTASVNFYPVPETDYSIKYRRLSYLSNATTTDAPIDIPRGGELMIVYLLAALLAPVYGLNRNEFYQLGETEKRNFLAGQSESWGKDLTGKPQQGIV